MRLIDRTNEKYGKLTVLYRAPNKGKKVYWHCKCECGTEIDVSADNLRNGHTTSCGCAKREIASLIGKQNKKDLIGKRFGKLVVIEDSNKRKNNNVIWKCQCDCGNLTNANASDLVKGSIKSCGCIKKSWGEAEIEHILRENNISFIKEFAVPELNYARFDFAILQNNIIDRIIEFDGEHHFKQVNFHKDQYYNLKDIQNKDQIKNTWCFANHIPIVRIPYTERDHITLNMLLSDQYLVEEL